MLLYCEVRTVVEESGGAFKSLMGEKRKLVSLMLKEARNRSSAKSTFGVFTVVPALS